MRNELASGRGSPSGRASHRRRRWLSVGMLLLASALLLATSPPSDSLSEAVGDMAIAPDAPGEAAVRFTVRSFRELTDLTVSADSRAFEDSRLDPTLSIEVDGEPVEVDPGGQRQAIDPGTCIERCVIDARLTVTWNGPPGLELRTDWALRARADSNTSIGAAVLAGSGLPPRAAWVLAGYALAIAAVVGLSRLSQRAEIFHLALGTGVVLPLGWLLWSELTRSMPGLERWPRFFDVEDWIVPLVAAALLGGALMGAFRAWADRGMTILRVTGAIGALVLGFVWWRSVEVAQTYRPHEVVLVSLVLAAVCVSAATAPARSVGAEPSAVGHRRIGVGTSMVLAAQLLIGVIPLWGVIVVMASIAGFLIETASVGLDISELPSLFVTAVGMVIVLAIAALFARGLREWWRGRPSPLFILNVPIALAVVLGGGWAVLQSMGGGFALIDPEVQVIVVIAIVVAISGTWGLLIVDPPGSNEERQRQGGKGEEVGWVANEGDRSGPGD
jgi:hypothetical protein